MPCPIQCLFKCKGGLFKIAWVLNPCKYMYVQICRSKLLFSCKLFYHNKSRGKRLLSSSIENTVCFILDDVIDICFPGQETVTNHPAHESGFNEFVKTQSLSRKSNQINIINTGLKVNYSLGRFFFTCILLKSLLQLLDSLPPEAGQARVQHQLVEWGLIKKNRENRSNVTWTR